MADAPRGAAAPILPTGTHACPVPEAKRHYCSRCGHSGDYAGTGPHTCPGCECKLAPVPAGHAPIMPADPAQPCTMDTEAAALSLASRVTELSIEATEVAALVSVCVAELDGNFPSPEFYRKRALTMLYLAEKMAERLALTLSDGSLLNLAATDRKTEGGAA